MKLDIGGGARPKAGFINVDRCDGANQRIDLEEGHLPFPDGSVIEIHSSHCLEHVRNLKALMREMLRVSQVGATWELRLPWWLSSMAMCYEHCHVLSGPPQVEHWTGSAADWWWGGITKRLRLIRKELVPGEDYEEARKLFPHLSPEEVKRFIPGTCHEVAYWLEVVPHVD